MELKQRLTTIKNNLTSILDAANTQLVNKGASAVTELDNVATAIGTIPTGITPTGEIEITQNGIYDVTDYASASVAVPNDDSELVGVLEGTIETIKNVHITILRQTVFQNISTIKKIEFPNLTTLSQYAFYNCTRLEFADVGKSEVIKASTFSYCSRLTTVIIRKSTLCELQQIIAFNQTPFRNGTGGTVYVPQALVSSYQNATNWSALESTTFLPIEGSEYE